MKKKYLAAILGVMMAATSVTACGAATTDTKDTAAESSDDKDTEDTAADSTDEESSDSSADADKESSDKEDSSKEDSDEDDVTYGEVKSVEDGKITIAVGTIKEMDGNGGAPGGDSGEAPEVLEEPQEEIREKYLRNQMEITEMEKLRKNQTEIAETVSPQAVIRAVRRTAIIPRAKTSNSPTSRKVTL